METPLLKAELESLAKLSAKQPHAQELKEYFDICFAEARSLVILEELRHRKATSITSLVKSAHKSP